jgi:TonB family protein
MKGFLPALVVSALFHAAVVFFPFCSGRDECAAEVKRAQVSIDVDLVRVQPMRKVEEMPAEDDVVDLPQDETGQKTVAPPVAEETEYSGPESEPEREENVMETGALGEEVKALLINKPPVYPLIARVNGWEGEVTVRADIDAQGKVFNVNLLKTSGYKALDASAVKAIRTWRFTGAGRELSVTVPVRFVLKK